MNAHMHQPLQTGPGPHKENFGIYWSRMCSTIKVLIVQGGAEYTGLFTFVV